MKTKRTAGTVPRILVPIDFTECSRQAVQTAIPLLNLFCATLVLEYVVESQSPGSEFLSERRAELEGDLGKLGRKELLRFRRGHIPASCNCECLVRSGQPDTEILAVAGDVKPAMIVMAAHGKDSKRGQLGRTAERVAAMAPCPVLLVPVNERCVPFFI